MSRQRNRLRYGGRIDRSRQLRFEFDGVSYKGHPGDTLASALLANGVDLLGRSFKYHRPRGVMSAGVEENGAIVTVLGREGDPSRRDPNTRATTQELYAGLSACSQNAWPSVKRDVGAVNSVFGRFFAAGFYYKTFIGPGRGTWSWMQYEKVIRRAAGMGVASREPDPDLYETINDFCDVLVVGGGPAGLTAAVTAAERGLDVLLAEQDFELGGAMLSEPGQEAERLALLRRLQAAGARVLTRTSVFGLYDQGVAGLVERLTDHVANPSTHTPRQRLRVTRAGRVILASGAIERLFAFGDNDRPGVMNASAVQTYLNRFGVRPGRKAVVATNNDSAYTAAAALARAGASVQVLDSRPVVPAGARALAEGVGAQVQSSTVPIRALGKRLNGVETGRWDGRLAVAEDRVEADLLAVSGGWSPVVHLHSQRGAKPVYRPSLGAFVPGPAPEHELLHVCGAAAGLLDHDACCESGHAAALQAAHKLGAEPRWTPSVPVPRRDFTPLWEVKAENRKLKSFIDPMNDVTTDDVRLASREGYSAVEHLKRYTTLGMSVDQGKIGNIVGLAVLAAAEGKSIDETGTTTFRPPYAPVPLGALAGSARGAHFKPLRRTPTHEWNLEHGAVMTEAGLWRRPWYYPEKDESLDDAYVREMKVVRRRVGLSDVTSLGKIVVQGPDAAEFLNRIYVNPMLKLPVGKARYGVMLRDDGIPFDDGTVWRLGEDDFFLTTTTAAAARVMAWLEELHQTRWPDLRVRLDSATDAWSGTAVAGPRARKVLQAVVEGVDLSPEGLPFMGVREGRLAGAPCRIARISFSGELGYEVYVPSSHGPAAMTALWAAAKAEGGCLYGLEAMGGMRIEKGFITHAEMDGRVSLSDLGLGRMASLRKDFVGKAMMRRPDLLCEGRQQLVGLRPTDRGDRLAGGSILCRPGAVKGQGEGWVSAATYSPSLGHWIALGFISGGLDAWRGQDAVMADPVRGREVQVEVVSPIFVDPEGVRVNG